MYYKSILKSNILDSKSLRTHKYRHTEGVYTREFHIPMSKMCYLKLQKIRSCYEISSPLNCKSHQKYDRKIS